MPHERLGCYFVGDRGTEGHETFGGEGGRLLHSCAVAVRRLRAEGRTASPTWRLWECSW